MGLAHRANATPAQNGLACADDPGNFRNIAMKGKTQPLRGGGLF